MERSALPTKDCKSRARGGGAARAQVPRRSAGLGRPAGGQHRLMPPPLAGAPAGPPRRGRRAGRVQGRSMVSDFPGWPELPGILGALGGDAPPALPARGAPSRRFTGSCLGRICNHSGFPYPNPICLDGLVLEETAGFSSSSFMCSFPPRR